MSSTALVSDSTAGLSEDFVRRHDISVVPLYLKIGETTYRDGLDITPDEFYARLPNCDVLPTTSQPSVGDFEQVYGQLAEQGVTDIISIHLSSEISGTVNSANQAASQMRGLRIEVVDTLCAAGAHRLAVETGAGCLECGASFEETVAAVMRVVDHQRTLFVVDTLEYLYKGGRIGGAAALVGSLLQFKPLLCIREGKVDALERVRVSGRALRRMVDIMGDWLGSEGPLQAMVMHAACLEEAESLAELLPQRLDVANVRIMALPPVLGAHVGNGTLGLCCCPASACGMPEQES